MVQQLHLGKMMVDVLLFSNKVTTNVLHQVERKVALTARVPREIIPGFFGSEFHLSKELFPDVEHSIF